MVRLKNSTGVEAPLIQIEGQRSTWATIHAVRPSTPTLAELLKKRSNWRADLWVQMGSPVELKCAPVELVVIPAKSKGRQNKLGQ